MGQKWPAGHRTPTPRSDALQQVPAACLAELWRGGTDWAHKAGWAGLHGGGNMKLRAVDAWATHSDVCSASPRRRWSHF